MTNLIGSTNAHAKLSPRWWARVYRFLASLQLAVVLLATLAAVLAHATILETQHGPAYAQWFVYKSDWFVGLLSLLGLNIFLAAAIRFPWKRHQTGFVVTHLGLLVLLTGSIQSFVGGVEGQVRLAEGQSTSQMTLSKRSQITAAWMRKPNEPPYEFTFNAGPIDWDPGKTLPLGKVDGVGARVLRFIRHAEAVESWIPDRAQVGGPAIKIIVHGPQGKPIVDQWVADEGFGGELPLGPTRIRFERAASPEIFNEYFYPPENIGSDGLLVAYIDGHVERINVKESIGKRIPLGESGAAVEIIKYLPNAQPNAMGRFHSKDDLPDNPMLELRVYLANRKAPLRQIAFVKEPLLTLDGVYGRICPVKFRFFHSAVKPEDGIDFVQSAEGKLFLRTASMGEYQMLKETKVGESIELPAGFQITLGDHLLHARRNVDFKSVSVGPRDKDPPQPAVLLEITAGGSTQPVWLQLGHFAYGQRVCVTPKGELTLKYGFGSAPLGFSIKLLDFQRRTNPGNVGNASYASTVQLLDREQAIDRQVVVSMNDPLTHGKFTIYQSSFDNMGHGKESSTFSVVYDPGRFLKYLGSLFICLGIAIMFYMQAYFFKRISSRRGVSDALRDDVASPNETGQDVQAVERLAG